MAHINAHDGPKNCGWMAYLMVDQLCACCHPSNSRPPPVAWWEWGFGGGSLINGAPSDTCFFPLCLERVSCHRHNMVWPSVIVQYSWVPGGAISPPPSPSRFKGRALWKLQRICILQYLYLGLNLTKVKRELDWKLKANIKLLTVRMFI